MTADIGPVLPHLPTALELSGRIVFAAFLGSLIGLEREVSDHPSGLRTHIAVAIGAALFGITSAYAFQEFVALRNDNNYQIDVTRIASQVVVGVGFLGGGAIIKQGNTVRGLTSAAGLWVSAAVGLAVSLGMYIEAGVSTATLVIALVLLKRPRHWLRGRLADVRESIVVTLSIDADPSGVVGALSALPDTVLHSLAVKRREDDGVTVVQADLEIRGGMLETRLSALGERPDVLSIEVS